MELSPAKRALETPEILEMILAQLDMRTLLKSAQRVSRAWTNLISKSPSLQKILFFTPIKDSEWVVEKTLNPLLAETFRSFFPAEKRSNRFEFSFSKLPMAKDDEAMARFVREDASWRRMLVQQPPLENIGLYHISHAMGGDSGDSSGMPAHSKPQDPELSGLRMERLFETLLFSSDVQFLRWTKSRVYWSTEQPIHFDESNKRINAAFHDIMDKFGLVVYTHEVIQCCSSPEAPTPAERVRLKIVKAYRKQGLDVGAKRKDIEGSKCELGSR